MPRDKSIKRVLVIGSGPIVIGQAAEFDYAGTQACRALKEDGVEVILVNSNPATIMTDNLMADHIYIEPLTLATVKRVIEKEKPDSILSGMGGQTGLTLCMQLARDGFLEKRGVRLLGASPETIDKAEDRQIFKDTMESIGQPVIPSKVVTTVDDALAFADEIGYPVIIRPAFTLGGSGGGIAGDARELRETAANGLMLSPITQILVERCVSGWKEIEFEVIRDGRGNVIAICSMENVDPVGVHTGDSIVVAPALTLSDPEYGMLRTAALNIVEALGVEGGCNCQFAMHPHSAEYAVIEVNPRVSRSSALASKATGYPIAKVATKIALGYTLDEIPNAVTGTTMAAFEPSIDYVALKFPKWPFDKFVYAKNELGTQMKATGEVMSIADSFEMALLKAVRGAEIGLDTLNMPKLAALTDSQLAAQLPRATDERIFVVYESLKRGVPVETVHEVTQIDEWFLNKLENLCAMERELAERRGGAGLYLRAKKAGYTDDAIERLGGLKPETRLEPVYRIVDTCAAEHTAVTPYFYAAYETAESGGVNEAAKRVGTGKTIIVLGSGPIRIGQGIEFDYASVHCVWALKRMGYQVVIINNNPETVSTDFDTADRLYFEPLTPEDVMNVVRLEKPVGVVVAFGGQTAIKLTKFLHSQGVPIIGTPADSIDMAEDRERFDSLLERLGIMRPRGLTVMTEKQALEAANTLGYPVLMRPSYVLGGQNMIIAHGDRDICEYMEIILRMKPDNAVLIDQYVAGMEIEVDAICDGRDILIPGIMEHIERTGVHSGDSIALYPSEHISDALAGRIETMTRELCLALKVSGLINLQYIVAGKDVYVIEVNPRASRTVPYISKVTGIPICELATRVSLGERLGEGENKRFGTGIYKNSPYTAVKVPVFSFEKLTDVDTHLGPEMKSTGEVLGIGKNMEEALYKGLIAAGYKMRRDGGVFITVRDSDKGEVADVAKRFARLGFELYATAGTAAVLKRSGLDAKTVNKIHEAENNTMTLLESGTLSYILSTSAKGRDPARDSVKIRRKAALLGIPCLTSLDTARALTDSLISRYSEGSTELVDINNLRKEKLLLVFTKMHAIGNDYIYIDYFKQGFLENVLKSPESLSIFLADRHYGVGGDGVVLIGPSAIEGVDARMRMFNLDGSEGRMAGNAIRCVAKYLYDTDIVKKLKMRIETASGINTLELETKDGRVSLVTVDMGAPGFLPEEVPVKLKAREYKGRQMVVDAPIEVDGAEYKVTCMSLGNPHCVVFAGNGVDSVPLERIGPMFENHKLFPERVNTEFVEVLPDNVLKVRVWERGSGETFACGTGACAAAVAAVMLGHCEKDKDIRVLLLGGELVVRYNYDLINGEYHNERVYMTGSASKAYDGVVEI